MTGKREKIHPKTLRRLRRLRRGMTLALFAVAAVSAAVWFVFASSVSERRDQMSNQAAGAASSHQIGFTLGGSLAAGEKVTLDFREDEGGLSVSGTTATTSDFDFRDKVGGVFRQRTIRAVTTGTPDCSGHVGTDDMVVGIDDPAGTVSFHACGNYVSSDTGSEIAIFIGSGSGKPGATDRIVNPAVSGSYLLDILDAGGECTLPGDSCGIGLMVIDSNAVTITASVGSGGGGGGGGGTDTIPPVISDIRCEEITGSSLKFRFVTDEAATTEVRYGQTTGYGQDYLDSAAVIDHSAPVFGLSQSTEYHYQVRATDLANNISPWSDDRTCTTIDDMPPVISNVSCTPSPNSLTIAWDTDENADSRVDYGLTAGYGMNVTDPAPVMSHQAVISGLTASTEYHYRITSTDASENGRMTDDAICSTTAVGDTAPPVISGMQVTQITATSVTVTWATDEPSTGFVDFGTAVPPPYSLTAGSASPLSVSHTVTLTGLSEDTTHNFQVRSADAAGNSAVSGNSTFRTAETVPPVISNVRALNITHNSARISWDTDENADSRVDYGLTVAYGSSKADGTAVLAHQIDLTGLTPNTTYSYKVTSKDAFGNSASSANLTFKTVLPPPPAISNVRATNVTETSARIQWDTTTASDSTVDYGLNDAYGNRVAVATAVTAHAIQLNGLAKGKTYHYKVGSTDAYGQSAVSGNLTFQTLADIIPPANPSGLSAVSGDAQVQLSWTNPTDADFQGVILVRSVTAYPANPTDGTEAYRGTGQSFLDSTVVNGLTYFYTLFSFDDVPNHSSGTVASGNPVGPPDSTPPGNVTGLTAVPGDGRIQLSWTNPTDPDFSGVLIVRKTLTCPESRTDGTPVYDGKDTAKLDTGLANGTLYCYRAWTCDGVPNWSSGVTASAMPVAPPDTDAPGTPTGLAASPGNSAVQLSWTNPSEPDWAGTRIVRKVGGYPNGPSDGTIVFDGRGDSRLDQGLTNGITYYYSAYSYDTSLNWSSPATALAVPQEGAVIQPPQCTDTDGGRVYSVRGTVTDSLGNSEEDSCLDSRTVKENYCDGGQAQRENVACGDGFRCSAGQCVPESFVPTSNVCGDGLCADNENAINCPSDCPLNPELPPTEPSVPTVEIGERITLNDLIFRSTRGRIRLRIGEGGRIGVYRSMTVDVMLPDISIRKPIASAFVGFGGSTYQMKQAGSYQATLMMPSSVGERPLDVIVNYEDGTSDGVRATMLMKDTGSVSGSVEGQDRPLGGARVMLLADYGGGNFGLWDAASFGQQNPQLTDQNGEYRFIVPEGTYRLQAEADGYESRTTLPFPIRDENVITNRLRLTKKPDKTVREVMAEDISISEKAVGVAVAATEQAAATVSSAIETVREAIGNQLVEEGAERVAAPTAVAVAAVNVVTIGTTTAASIPYLMYLASFLAHPALLFGRRRRKQWGMVYNSLSKMPVDLAIVRLLDGKTGRVIRSSVTDREGRYVFIIQPGEYRLSVSKNGFVFPSAYLKGRKEDGRLVDIYHGETLDVREGTTVTANIPLDPLEAEKTPRQVVWAGIARRFQKSLGVLSILAMAAVSVISPTPLMFVLLAGNIAMYLAFRRLSVGRRPKNWGIVYDSATRKPIRNAVARIFESQFNKLLETQVTDFRGRYSFLVGQNTYFVTFEKAGYGKRQRGPVDLTVEKREREGLLAIDVGLDPAEGKDGTTEIPP
ncbi:fibronectin type III domain-containing protein [Candidatus Uhrbacteria bacterium]|nr:fibronectin type III domain-containing protein [Candidatus Uhrbacteria bacterium]